MPLKINVPYSDKDVAKSKGAFWDVDSKTWFVPDHKDINDFMQWIDIDNVSLITKSPIYIALNMRECYRCAEKTLVISLASDNFYYLNEDENENQKWFLSDDLSFFSMPTYMEKELEDILSQTFQNYKIGYSRMAEGSYWANHCKHCGALQGDFHLHSEPGGAFFPLDIEEYEQITFVSIKTKFDLKIKAGHSWLSNSDEILNYAKSITLEEFLEQRK